MKHMKRYILALSLLVAFMLPSTMKAQVDAGRALAITAMTPQGKKALENESKRQMLMAAGHELIKIEMEKTTNFQKKFNDYLDMFHDELVMAAELFCIYNEVQKTIKGVNGLADAVSSAPNNAIAAAFSSKRNTYYRKMIKTSLEIVNDIRETCFDGKKTEKNQMDIISRIIPKLKQFNLEMRQLERIIRHSTMSDVWREITGRYERYQAKTRREIVTASMRNWQRTFNR